MPSFRLPKTRTTTPPGSAAQVHHGQSAPAPDEPAVAQDTGTHSDSFFSQYFVPPDSDEGSQHGDEEREILKWTAGSIYAGGAHTTTSAIASFLLFMSTHPAAQKRAQDAIDAHLGGAGRLLALEDQKALPYASALIKEPHRFAPLGLGHRVTKDDVYNGL
ncbi:cytochrome P450 [Mycena olivaceomarginata]|nr:cytochrome P450 [Mycena olivaceomarginata]